MLGIDADKIVGLPPKSFEREELVDADLEPEVAGVADADLDADADAGADVDANADADADETTGASPGTAQACSDLGLNSLESNLQRFNIKPPGVS